MQNNYDSRTKFRDLTSPSYFIRVNEVHPLDIYLGRNDEGEKSLRFIGNFDRVKIISSKIIAVSHLKKDQKIILNFSLKDPRFDDLFFIFCNDLIDSSVGMKQYQGYEFLVNRFDKWRSFGQLSRDILTETEIKGLLGELLFLNDVGLVDYDEFSAISAWTGTEPTDKDFYFSDYWYEIKVTTSEKVQISSLDQLESSQEGKLVVYTFEKRSPEASGITLNAMVSHILDKLAYRSNQESFLLKLYQIGYIYNENYDQYVYEVKSFKKFKIVEGFPLIKKQDLNDAIVDVKYTLLLNLINKYLEE